MMSDISRVTLSYRGYGILKSEFSPEELEELKKELNVRPIAIPGYTDDPEFYPVYRLSESRIYVPKYYGLEKFKDRFKDEDIVNKERTGTSIALKFSGTLRDDQLNYANRLLKHLSINDACIPCAKTGEGKTVFTLDMICRIAKKTLIIVHKDFLLTQWSERIKQFVRESGNNCNVSIIRGKTIDVSGSIVIGMLQSISMKEYPKGTFDDFGLVVIDECHHICAKTFSKALFKIGTKKMIGLSATPDRPDGLTRVLKWFLGPIIQKEQVVSVRIETPEVRIIKAKYSTDIKIKYHQKKGLTVPNVPDLITQISKDSLRNEQILEQIVKYHAIGRNIIVLSDRRGQCEDLKDQLESKGIKSGLYLGSMKPKALDESNSCSVILATYSMASEGYDNAKLDTLIFATGKSNIVQSCGRILRKKNEFSPLIIDIADSVYQAGQYKKRKAYYKKQGYIVIEETEGSGSDSDEESDNNFDEGSEEEPDGPKGPKKSRKKSTKSAKKLIFREDSDDDD
jgi:superfamily II DNA or RNA helicase